MDRSLPDKAIDLIDEASSRAKVKTNYESAEVKNLKLKLEKVEAEKEIAVNQEDFEKASKLRDQAIKIKEEIERLKSIPSKGASSVVEITEHDIAEVISKWANIPLTKLTEGEAEKLLKGELDLVISYIKNKSFGTGIGKIFNCLFELIRCSG